jgi:LDH2 family malate/lactate/ureidoglycolate dehydrogenase
VSAMNVGGLTRFAECVLERSGVPIDDAATIATVLVRTSARGSRTHGVGRLGLYVTWIENGVVNPRARVRSCADRGAVSILDGDRGLGHLVADRAIRLGIARAHEYGITAIAVRNSSHLGALGHYALTAAEAGMAALIWTNTPQVMQPSGGRGRLIGNGPMAFGFPRRPVPVLFDSAMSVASGSKVGIAADRGEPVPLGWLVDADGIPTSDAGAYRRGGALTSIGEHKGFGLALLGEFLAGVLTGAAMLSDVPQFTPGMSQAPGIGHFIIVFDPECFLLPALLAERVDRLEAELKASPDSATGPGVRLPGDSAHVREEQAHRDGLDVDDEDMAALERLAERLGCAGLLAAARC